MKLLFIALMMLSSISAFACSCEGSGPMDSDPLISQVLKEVLGDNIQIEKQNGYLKMDTIKTYPTIGDRIALDVMGMRNTSCHTEGPNGEDHFHCTKKSKADYAVYIIKENGEKCVARVQSTSTTKKVKVKFLGSNC